METPKSKSTTEETYAGDGTFLHLTLGQAIRTALFEDDPEIIAQVFGFLREGIDDEEGKSPKSPLFSDADIRRSIDEIKRLLAPPGEGGSVPGATQIGTFRVRAARMTKEERLELADNIWALFCHVTYFRR